MSERHLPQCALDALQHACPHRAPAGAGGGAVAEGEVRIEPEERAGPDERQLHPALPIVIAVLESFLYFYAPAV